MDSSLSECFGDDGGLFEFDAEAEVDQRVEKACRMSKARSSIVSSGREPTSKHPHKQVIGVFTAGEDIFVHDGLPTFLVHFRLEKGHEVVEISA